MLRVLIADDHEIVRRGLKQVLLDEFAFLTVAEVGDAIELIKKCNEQEWDIVISDLFMPGGGGFAALKVIKEKMPHLPVLILSIYPEEQYALRVLKAGASGYLNKDAAGSELVKAIGQILSGKKYMSREITEQYYSSPLSDNQLLHEILSERELEVFILLASGFSFADIAQSLKVNVSTVSTYRSRILEKMNMKSNAEITKYAIEFKLIS